ncbi:MAG: hypothetical protein VYC42_02025 [Pseudomonadota bacterium]|uniref:hypothetical protein n=1 Tax=Sinimarinibacterium flocculans TaxID=985250 RepID=UPI0024911926|nr:hypothetical protein [Sinimarinibacterium flocculans]MEC9361977.1 hypothetical protein [Pseudomonadota bacterium]
MESAFSILGAVASIVGLLLPARGWGQRLSHVAYGVVIVILAYFATTYHKRLDRIARIEHVAKQMVEDRQMHYTHLGFVQASLAFLEKNNDLFPDTYRRAIDLCAQYKCSEPQSGTDMVELAFAMDGILTGLATIDRDF